MILYRNWPKFDLCSKFVFSLFLSCVNHSLAYLQSLWSRPPLTTRIAANQGKFVIIDVDDLVLAAFVFRKIEACITFLSYVSDDLAACEQNRLGRLKTIEKNVEIIKF